MKTSIQPDWGMRLRHGATLLVLLALLLASGSARATSLRSLAPDQNGSAWPNHGEARRAHAEVARDTLGRPRLPWATSPNCASPTGHGGATPNVASSPRGTASRASSRLMPASADNTSAHTKVSRRV